MTRLKTFRLKSMWGNYNFNFAYSMARGRSGGLISMWDPNSFIKDDIWCDDAFIIVKGHWRNTVSDCYMINIYGPQDSLAKANLWNRIGDFMHQHADNFNSFIDNSGLIHLPLDSPLFTWMNKVGTKLSKLDRFLILEEVAEALPDVCITAIDHLWSDHNPILLHVAKSDFGPTRFKLFHTWLLRDSFDEVIKTELPKLEEHNFGRKLLSHEKFLLLKAIIKQWHSETKTSDRVTKHDNLLDTFEYFDLFQKARVKWDIEGDENSKFFHGLILQKRRAQMIHGIMKEGVWILNPSQIKEEFLNFFEEKFKVHDSNVDLPSFANSSRLCALKRDSLETHVL
ncbi:RNA-directed DNA polymerase, eukaryota, reverse transcriptase zinc-binding domain protein [Tanacetum coccineum]